MLFADKQALETDLKVSLLAIRERELELYTDNCRNIGAQAALLAGFAYSALTFEMMDVDTVCTAELAMSRDCDAASESEVFTSLYRLCATLSMMLNFAAAFGSTFVSMLGPGLALRGQDGAMDQAVEGLALEYRTTFLLFLSGIFSFFLCAVLFIGGDYDPQYGWADLTMHVCLVLFFFHFVKSTLETMKRIWKKFRLPPEIAVAGSFDPDGGGSTRGRSPESLELERLSIHKTWTQWPRRQYLYASIFMDDFIGISNKVRPRPHRSHVRWQLAFHSRLQAATLLSRALHSPCQPMPARATAIATRSRSLSLSATTRLHRSSKNATRRALARRSRTRVAGRRIRGCTRSFATSSAPLPQEPPPLAPAA